MVQTQVNPGHFQILATDKTKNADEHFGPEFADYRKKWNEVATKHIVLPFPLHLDIESVSACNLKCIMCPWHGEQFKDLNLKGGGLGYMKWDLFVKIMDEAAKFKVPSIKFNYRGEPLLHPKLAEMVRYAKSKGVLEVQFNSNGLTLDEKKARDLIDAGLDRIIISFDGATKETYEKVRVLSNFERVVGNIKRLVEIRDSLGRVKPSVRVQMCVQPENEAEVDQFASMWIDTVNRIAFGIKKDPTKIEHGYSFPCPQIWQRLMICFDGEVRACCGDWNGEMPLGHFPEQSLESIWHSEFLTKLRETHLAGRDSEIPVCAKCEINKVRTHDKVEAIVSKYNNRIISLPFDKETGA